MDKEIITDSYHENSCLATTTTTNKKACMAEEATAIQVNGEQLPGEDAPKNINKRPTNLFVVSNKNSLAGTTNQMLATKYRKNKSTVQVAADNNGNISLQNNRRQSLPIGSGNLVVPQSPMLSSSFTQGCDLVTHFTPGSPRRYSATSCTPLLTPAISISSLVSSLEGSLDDLNITSEDGDNSYDTTPSSEQNSHQTTEQLFQYTEQLKNHSNHPEQFAILFEKNQDIIDSRLQRYFDTLEKTQFFENPDDNHQQFEHSDNMNDNKTSRACEHPQTFTTQG